MRKAFAAALDAGLVEPATGPDGVQMCVDGVNYYQPSNGGANLMMKRFHAFSDLLKRHDVLKLTDATMETGLVTMRDRLKLALKSLVADVDTASDCIRDVLTLVERMQTRRSLGMDLMQVYEVAAVWYFGEDEDPGDPDMSLNRAKVKAFAAAGPELFAFFLSQPVGSFFPLHALFTESTRSYMANLSTLEIVDWTLMLLKLRTSGAESATISTIEQHRETLYGSLGLLQQPWNPTTTM